MFLEADARNNKNETGLEYLSSIKEKCKHLIWLNSEEKSDWNSGDSIIGIYKPFIDEIFQTTTVNELTRFLSELKLG